MSSKTLHGYQIVHEAGQYKIRELWSSDDGKGRWSVGTIGPRGGWRDIMDYDSEPAAKHLCNALDHAEWLEERSR